MASPADIAPNQNFFIAWVEFCCARALLRMSGTYCRPITATKFKKRPGELDGMVKGLFEQGYHLYGGVLTPSQKTTTLISAKP